MNGDDMTADADLVRHGSCRACGRAVGWDATVCPACGATFDPQELVAVYVTADAPLLPLLTSALDAAGVTHVEQGERALGLFPLGSLATGLTRNLLAATILVPRAEAAAAVEVLGGLAPGERDDADDDDEARDEETPR
jgi:hypothetical protein